MEALSQCRLQISLALEISMMSETFPWMEVIIYIVIGAIAASALLFRFRKMEFHQKNRLLATGLGLFALVYVVLALTTLNVIWISVELAGLLLIAIFIVLAYRFSIWFLVMGWLAHIIWDMGVSPQETAPYVPFWYAWVCVGFDAVIALYLSVVLARHEHA